MAADKSHQSHHRLLSSLLSHVADIHHIVHKHIINYFPILVNAFGNVLYISIFSQSIRLIHDLLISAQRLARPEAAGELAQVGSVADETEVTPVGGEEAGVLG